jgi:acetylornithine deacetylase
MTMVDQEFAWRVGRTVEALTSEMVDLLSASVKCPSVTGAERQVADLYCAWMSDLGWQPKLRPLREAPDLGSEEPADRSNLVVRRGCPGAPLVVLNGHLDVVPVGPLDAWTKSPFSGDMHDGRVVGRGSVDMKGGVAAALWALRALEMAGIELQCEVELQLVVGEEATGSGTRFAASELDLGSVAAAIVLEPSGNEIVVVNTGLQFFEVTVDGKAAHTSAPWAGVDAFEKLLIVREAMMSVAEHRSRSYSHPLFEDLPTALPFAIGMVSAGTYRASVPASASMSGRIGLIPGESLDKARAEYEAAVAEAVDQDDWLRTHPPAMRWNHRGLAGWETAQDEALVLALTSALQHTAGRARIAGFTAGTDAAVYGAAHVPTVVFGPGDVALAHAPNEWVSVKDVAVAAETLALALAAM